MPGLVRLRDSKPRYDGGGGCAHRGVRLVPRGCRLPLRIPLWAAPLRWLRRNLLIFLRVGFSCQREGRRSESGLVLHLFKAPSRSCARGLCSLSSSLIVGAAGVPFRAAKVEESEVCFLLAERVGVDAKGQLGVGVTQL